MTTAMAVALFERSPFPCHLSHYDHVVDITGLC
jgi:hypothetical protein